MSQIQQVELTEFQTQQGKILSPETTVLLEHEIASLEDTMLNIVFHAEPVLRETAILQYVEAQAKRNALGALLQDSADIRARLHELQSSVNQS